MTEDGIKAAKTNRCAAKEGLAQQGKTVEHFVSNKQPTDEVTLF